MKGCRQRRIAGVLPRPSRGGEKVASLILGVVLLCACGGPKAPGKPAYRDASTTTNYRPSVMEFFLEGDRKCWLPESARFAPETDTVSSSDDQRCPRQSGELLSVLS